MRDKLFRSIIKIYESGAIIAIQGIDTIIHK